jgi:hypothetical protein
MRVSTAAAPDSNAVVVPRGSGEALTAATTADDRELPLADVPEDLQLPTPANPTRRLLAGCIDGTVSCITGAAVALAVHQGVGVTEAAEAAGIMAGTLAWTVRDCVLDEGNRSLGKKLQGIEITFWDGTLAHRSDCLKRNAYWLLFPFLYFHPLCNQVRGPLLVVTLSRIASAWPVVRLERLLRGVRSLCTSRWCSTLRPWC